MLGPAVAGGSEISVGTTQGVIVGGTGVAVTGIVVDGGAASASVTVGRGRKSTLLAASTPVTGREVAEALRKR
jgi:hypothetical protein